jgi:hypothetical protein
MRAVVERKALLLVFSGLCLRKSWKHEKMRGRPGLNMLGLRVIKTSVWVFQA